MRIAFINYFQNSVSRGLETFVSELSSRLVKNHEVFIADSPRNSLAPAMKLSLSRRLFLDPTNLSIAIWTIRVLPILRRFRPQVVVATNGGWQALLLSVYCRLTGAKLVIAGQSGPGWDDRWNLLMKPHLFVALTNRQLSWARKATIWKQEFALIPNGVDLEQFTPSGKKVKLDLEKPIIMMVAASTPDKRVEEGIRAVAKLPRGSFLHLGKGPLDERISKLGYKLLGSKRFFHAAVSHEQMPEYYRSADLFTLCSVSSEAFGIVYLEAMACNLPVVATDDQSRREIIGAAGVFVKNPEDEEEYSKALETGLKKKWDNLPRRQAEKFSWDQIVRQYEKEFSKL